MKKLLLIVTVLAIPILSCTTTVTGAGVIYDESIPLEQSSHINVSNFGRITAYNGLTVNWGGTIQIPAGNTLLEANVYSQIGNTVYSGKGLLLRYNFQPGKYYFLRAGRAEGSSTVGIRIYAYDIGEKFTSSWSDFEAHFVEFIHFLNTDSGETPVLN
ncbi:MAG: hypothetical protein LBI28_11345 [Treponema sp.]|jgi:hypothetical protein|nr:hypothetical protein [Treponema sp.]